MTLNKYVQQELKRRTSAGKPVSKTVFLRALSIKSGVSLLTLQRVSNGELLKLYPKAKAISDATGGVVKVEALLG